MRAFNRPNGASAMPTAAALDISIKRRRFKGGVTSVSLSECKLLTHETGVRTSARRTGSRVERIGGGDDSSVRSQYRFLTNAMQVGAIDVAPSGRNCRSKRRKNDGGWLDQTTH